jgi:metal-responsive CopG/Arc/MetJ family transcriptional regulator
MHGSLYVYRIYRDDGKVRGMDNGVAVYLPKPLIERLDAVAHDELRSRTNATRWLLEQALREREPAGVGEPQEAS